MRCRRRDDGAAGYAEHAGHVAGFSALLPTKLTLSQSILQPVRDQVAARIDQELRKIAVADIVRAQEIVPWLRYTPLSTIPTVVPLLKSSIKIDAAPNVSTAPRSINRLCCYESTR